MLDLKIIGEVICFYREKKNMTQQDLAEYLYVTRQTISKWETGKSIPSIELMVELTKLFNITIDDLLYGQKSQNHDISYLLSHYPRQYIVNQIIRGMIKERLEDILYLFSSMERSIIINHVIKGSISADIKSLLPYLSKDERVRILKAFYKECKNDIKYFISCSERKLLEGKNEHKKNVAIFR